MINDFKVIYIAGAGRSGSTLLDMVLGSQDGVASAGELVNLTGCYLRREYCSCHETLDDCSVWGRVVREFQHRNNLDLAGLRLFSKEDLYFSHPGRIGAWIYAVIFPKSRRYIQYLNRLESLFQIYAEISGKSYLCDSSKSPVRLISITRVFGAHRVFPLQLIRNPRDIMLSLAKGLHKDLQKGVQSDIKPRPYLRTACWWLTVNLMCFFSVWWFSLSSVEIRYDRLCSATDSEIKKINGSFGYKSSIKRSHIAAGNRMRMLDNVQIRPASEGEDVKFMGSSLFYWVIRLLFKY